MKTNPKIQDLNKPLLLTEQELTRVLLPYTKGKRSLIKAIKDLWEVSIPTPNYRGNSLIKLIDPKSLKEYCKLLLEN